MNEKYAELREMKRKIEDYKKLLAKDFWRAVDVIFNKYPTLKSVSCGVNNHEWNDGDETYFGVYYEDGFDMKFKNKDENEEITGTINKDLIELFEATSDVHETIFSGEYGEITIDRDTINKNM